MGLFDFLKKDKSSEVALKKGMEKSSSKIASIFGNIFLGRKTIDAELLENIEEALITADIGPSAANEIIEFVRLQSSRGDLKEPEKVIDAIKSKIKSILIINEDMQTATTFPYVILVSGINGAGKTTSIAKLANMYSQAGKSVMLAAGDTFRAAAVDQLAVWGERLNVPVIRRPDGSDPASVIHDAINSAIAKNIDVLLADTAGRLHTKNNLMQELIKIRKVVANAVPGGPHESLLVIDATGGQNAIAQAKNFQEAAGINGVILTKLDGTAKGGVAVSIVKDLHIPIRYIGFGEGFEDLRPFDAESFTEALFSKQL